MPVCGDRRQCLALKSRRHACLWREKAVSRAKEQEACLFVEREGGVLHRTMLSVRGTSLQLVEGKVLYHTEDAFVVFEGEQFVEAQLCTQEWTL